MSQKIIDANLVSIVIPCFNAALYIKKTLDSILSQNDIDIEIIIVDDGSTDQSKKIVDTISNEKIKYYYQTNEGVSTARNLGFSHAKGKYVVFFDADDLMQKDYIKELVSFIEKENLDFVSGKVQKFNENGILSNIYRGVSNNAFEEILLYNINVVTCPSIYLFKKEFLLRNHLTFNTHLSSTADRFFLLQCALAGKTGIAIGQSKVYYRISVNSMSGKLTKQLVLDNENYYRELMQYNFISSSFKKKVLKKGYYILFVSFIKLKCFKKAIFYLYKITFLYFSYV